MARLRLGVLLVPLLLTSCTRAPLEKREEAMRKTSVPIVEDDLDLAQLANAVNDNAAQLEKTGPAELVFGPKKISKEAYLASLRRFSEILGSGEGRGEIYKRIEAEFDFYEVYGSQKWGDVFITSYYEPFLLGSRKKKDRFQQPLYRKPKDLVALDLALFDPKYAQDRKLRARVVDGKVLPYYSREEIDSKSALKGKGLEIAWVDAWDAFNAQIQGSCTVELPGGQRLRLVYADKNGWKYDSIGKFVAGQLPEGTEITMSVIENYVRSMSPAEAQALMNKNASYVFFEEAKSGATTFFGVPAQDGRTIATDQRFFPKGALAFLMAEKPVFDEASGPAPARWEKFSRFVLDQDIGGAITGGGRLDLFWGKGPGAGKVAGVMKQRGKLFYVLPREI